MTSVVKSHGFSKKINGLSTVEFEATSLGLVVTSQQPE